MATAGATASRSGLGLPERLVLDAIQQFLAGREWRANVQRFVDSRCESFVGLEEHKHEQYDMFNEYHGFVDAMLEATLADLGCSPEQLVAALERVSKTKGERDPLAALIDQLLAFGDFRSFSEMMTHRNAELQAHAMTQVAGTARGITSRDFKEEDVATIASIPSTGSAGSGTGAGTGAGAGAMSLNVAASQEALLARAKRELAEREIRVQELIASRLVAAEAAGELQPSEMSLLAWANAVAAMATLRGKPHRSHQDQARMQELREQLTRERLKVEMFVARRMAADNAHLRTKVNHARRTAAMAPPEDCPDDIEPEAKRAPLGASEELAWRIDRDSQLREATEHRRKVCIDWASARGLSLATVQEIYVFLLELIASDKDALQQSEEIRSFVCSRLTPADLPLVPAMLRWWLLEHQYDRNRQGLHLALRAVEMGVSVCELEALEAQGDGGNQPHQLVGSDDSQAPSTVPGLEWQECWDDGWCTVYYYNTRTGVSQWETPSCTYAPLATAQLPGGAVDESTSENATGRDVAAGFVVRGDAPRRRSLAHARDAANEAMRAAHDASRLSSIQTHVAKAVQCSVVTLRGGMDHGSNTGRRVSVMPGSGGAEAAQPVVESLPVVHTSGAGAGDKPATPTVTDPDGRVSTGQLVACPMPSYTTMTGLDPDIQPDDNLFASDKPSRAKPPTRNVGSAREALAVVSAVSSAAPSDVDDLESQLYSLAADNAREHEALTLVLQIEEARHKRWLAERTECRERAQFRSPRGPVAPRSASARVKSSASALSVPRSPMPAHLRGSHTVAVDAATGLGPAVVPEVPLRSARQRLENTNSSESPGSGGGQSVGARLPEWKHAYVTGPGGHRSGPLPRMRKPRVAARAVAASVPLATLVRETELLRRNVGKQRGGAAGCQATNKPSTRGASAAPGVSAGDGTGGDEEQLDSGNPVASWDISMTPAAIRYLSGLVEPLGEASEL